jgi:hypothetical protein
MSAELLTAEVGRKATVPGCGPLLLCYSAALAVSLVLHLHVMSYHGA